ncbi:MAG: winged helix-turn-helix transcriptional regulator [Burkholderiaceae bacterium]|nr:winged helix-turn-helix transcriptional regulator [Burkholderiaceae bacterium]
MTMPARKMSKTDFEALANFRYQLRRFLRFSEELTRRSGITPLQYQLMLQIRGFPGREWAGVAELAERLQAKHHGVVALISRCEAAGLVRRSASRSDQRRVEVTLTASGLKCLERLGRLHRDELRTVKLGFTVPGVAQARPATSRRHPGRRELPIAGR